MSSIGAGSVRQGYVDSCFGQLHYAEAGSGGRPMLLLHQTPRSWDEFRELLPLLGVTRRVLAMDMLGFGMSASLAAPQTVEQYAAGAVALLDALALERVTLVGHHTGAAVAVEVAAGHPERIDDLVLSSSPFNDAERRDSHMGGPSVDVAERQIDGSHLTRLWNLRAPYYPEGRPDLLDRFVRDALAHGVDPSEGHRAVARYVMEDRIGLVRARTLVIGASDDPFAFPRVSNVAAALTGAAEVRTEIIEGGRIPLMEEKAVEVCAAVDRFVKVPDLH